MRTDGAERTNRSAGAQALTNWSAIFQVIRQCRLRICVLFEDRLLDLSQLATLPEFRQVLRTAGLHKEKLVGNIVDCFRGFRKCQGEWLRLDNAYHYFSSHQLNPDALQDFVKEPVRGALYWEVHKQREILRLFEEINRLIKCGVFRPEENEIRLINLLLELVDSHTDVAVIRDVVGLLEQIAATKARIPEQSLLKAISFYKLAVDILAKNHEIDSLARAYFYLGGLSKNTAEKKEAYLAAAYYFFQCGNKMRTADACKRAANAAEKAAEPKEAAQYRLLAGYFNEQAGRHREAGINYEKAADFCPLERKWCFYVIAASNFQKARAFREADGIYRNKLRVLPLGDSHRQLVWLSNALLHLHEAEDLIAKGEQENRPFILMRLKAAAFAFERAAQLPTDDFELGLISLRFSADLYGRAAQYCDAETIQLELYHTSGFLYLALAKRMASVTYYPNGIGKAIEVLEYARNYFSLARQELIVLQVSKYMAQLSEFLI